MAPIDPRDFPGPEPAAAPKPDRFGRTLARLATYAPQIRAAFAWLVRYEASHRGQINWRECLVAAVWALSQYVAARGLDAEAGTATALGGSAAAAAILFLLLMGGPPEPEPEPEYAPDLRTADDFHSDPFGDGTPPAYDDRDERPPWYPGHGL